MCRSPTSTSRGRCRRMSLRRCPRTFGLMIVQYCACMGTRPVYHTFGMHRQAQAESYPKPIPGTRYTGQARFQQGTILNHLCRMHHHSVYTYVRSVQKGVRLVRHALHIQLGGHGRILCI